MKLLQLPNGALAVLRNSQERISKLKEALNTIEQLFKKLRVVYNECQKCAVEADDHTMLVPLMQTKERYFSCCTLRICAGLNVFYVSYYKIVEILDIFIKLLIFTAFPMLLA